MGFVASGEGGVGTAGVERGMAIRVCAHKSVLGLGMRLGERTCSPGVGVRDDAVVLVRAGAGEPWPCAGSAVARPCG